MTSTNILDVLRALVTLPADLFWPGVAWLLDHLRQLGATGAGVLVALLTATLAGLALVQQRHLNQALAANPARRLGFGPFLRMELWHSPFAIPLWPFRLL
ncbi:MAG TPA: hypothetical protein VEL74_13870, partial [Thermoanaerobaculia bacterium]|nr:hypothetical protein [Thermoanaerobaculia bacterium]